MKEPGGLSKRAAAGVVLHRPPPAGPSPPWHLFFSAPASESPAAPLSSAAGLCSQLTRRADASAQHLPAGAGPAREPSRGALESLVGRHSVQGLLRPACCWRASSSPGGEKGRRAPSSRTASSTLAIRRSMQAALDAAGLPILKGKGPCPHPTPRITPLHPAESCRRPKTTAEWRWEGIKELLHPSPQSSPVLMCSPAPGAYLALPGSLVKGLSVPRRTRPRWSGVRLSGAVHIPGSTTHQFPSSAYQF